MSDHPAESGEGADDLFGRWLAHHEKPSDDGEKPRPRRIPSAARPSEQAAPVTRPPASVARAEVEAGTVDHRDGLGPVARPSSFGVRRGLPGTAHSGPSGPPQKRDGEVAELDRQSPVGFEPVIIGSVRKKKDKDSSEPEEKTNRLKRLRSRVGQSSEDPAPAPTTAPAGGLYDEPVASVPPPPVFKTPPPPVFPAPVVAPAPAAEPEAEEQPQPRSKRKIVAYEDMVALATMAALPATEPEVDGAVVEDDPRATPEPVLPGPDLDPPTPQQVLPEQQDDEVPPMTAAAAVEPPPAASASTTTRRLVARPKPAAGGDERRPPAVRDRHTGSGTADAARGMIAAARAATPEAKPEPKSSRFSRAARSTEPAPTPEPAPERVPAEAAAPDPAVPSAPKMEMPPVYEFAPLKTSRRFLTVVLVAGLAVSGYVDYVAYQTRDSVTMGIAGILTFVTLVVWAIRAGASVTRLTVRGGQLEIVRQGGRMVFDLTSHYTPIEIVGKPGSKKWKVHFLRRGMAPVTIDSSMVDGKEFMRVLGYFRPELVGSR
jgi:hypothetical protein